MKRPGRKLATAERWKEICEARPESVVCPRGNVNMPHKKIVMGWRQILSPSYHEFSIGHSILSWHHSNKIHYCYIVPNLIIESEDIEDDQKSESQILISRSFFVGTIDRDV